MYDKYIIGSNTMDITTQCSNLLCNLKAEPKVSEHRCYECEINDRFDSPTVNELADYITDQAGCRKSAPSYVISDYLCCWLDNKKAKRIYDILDL